MPAYHVTVTLEDLRIISAALHELPYRLVKDLLTRMQAEVDAQAKAEESTAVIPEPAGEDLSQ